MTRRRGRGHDTTRERGHDAGPTPAPAPKVQNVRASPRHTVIGPRRGVLPPMLSVVTGRPAAA